MTAGVWSEPSGPAGRIDELESIRGVAALVVVIFHFPEWHAISDAIPLIRNGAAMVDVFFVLSGFVICRIYGGTIRRPRDLLRFQLLRFGRLYPVHLLFLAIFAGLEVFKLILGTTGLMAMQVPAFAANDGSALLANAALIHALGPERWFGTFNGPSWTISVEFWGYLVFAGLVMVLGRRRTPVLAALAVLGLVNLMWPMIDNREVIRCAAGFFTGCITAELCRNRSGRAWPAWVQAALLLALVAWLSLKPMLLMSLVGVAVLTALLIASLVNGEDGPVRRILRSAPLRWLGAISYSLYMAHYLVIYIVAQLVLRLAPPTAAGGDSLPQLPLGIALAVYAGMTVAILILSWLTWRWVERPCRAISRQLIFGRMGRFGDQSPEPDSKAPQKA